MIAAAAHEQQVSLTASTTPHEDDFAPTTCSEAVEHADGPRAPTPTSPCLSQGPACGTASGSKDEAIFIPSDSESESDSEAEVDVPSLKALNALIDKKTTTQPSRTSPASTITTVSNTPRADSSGFEVDNDLNGAVQQSPHDSLTTSVPPRQRPSDRLDSNRCSSSISTAEAAEQDDGQAKDANEPVSSHCDDHEAGDRAELPRQSHLHESADQNVSGSCDGDSHPSEDGDRVSSHDANSESSSDSDGGSDGDPDDDYNDDESSSDADGEDSGRSKKRGTDRSPSVTSSHPPNDPPDDNAEENPPRPHKRQKVAYDKEDMTPVHRQNSMPRSGGRLSRSPRRAQLASMLSPPASHNPSQSESHKVTDGGKASAASFVPTSEPTAGDATAKTGQEQQRRRSKTKG